MITRRFESSDLINVEISVFLKECVHNAKTLFSHASFQLSREALFCLSIVWVVASYREAESPCRASGNHFWRAVSGPAFNLD
jgi:hypothetical protein